jgi:hypothetical protein
MHVIMCLCTMMKTLTRTPLCTKARQEFPYPSPPTAHQQLDSYTITDIVTLVPPIRVSSCVALQRLKDARAPASPPPTQAPTNGRYPGTQKEHDLNRLEQEIISSPWYAVNALEPTCGTPACPYLADCYGVRGMSCYTALVDVKPNGTFGCWHEGCTTYSAGKIEDAVKHQRTNHFNHRPFLCTPTNGTIW